MINLIDLIFFLLRPLGFLYGLFMQVRAFLFHTGILQAYPPTLPVISIGNLTIGGSGKTPMVMYLAEFLRNRGKNVAVVSRGYGGSASDRVNIVSDGNHLFLSSTVAGDEPRLLAEKLPGVMVLTGRKRIYPIRHIECRTETEIILLDDGFQHLAVRRNLDIVLFNATTNFNRYKVMPGGVMREPFSSLKRAGCVCITGVTPTNGDNVSKLKHYLHTTFPELPVFTLATSGGQFIDRQGNGYPLEIINHKRIIGFCGIASPERFRNMVINTTGVLKNFLTYKDHHQYSLGDVQQIARIAQQENADFIITTEKDLVKLRNETFDTPLLALSIAIDPHPQLEEFISASMQLQ